MAAENKRYLDMLNLHSAEEAYRQVQELASSLSNDQHLIRSCIFDLHAAVEIELKRVFYHTFKGQLFLTDDEQHNSETVAELDKMIRRLGFAEMYRILRPALDSWPYPELKWIGEINNTRNAAAHRARNQPVWWYAGATEKSRNAPASFHTPLLLQAATRKR